MCPHFPRSIYSSRTLLQHCQCTAAVAAMPLVVKLLLLGRESLKKFTKEREQTQTDRRILATPVLWNVVGRPLSLTHSIQAAAAAASGLCCLCQPPPRGREIDKDSGR